MRAHRQRQRAAGQRGVVLIVALIVLVVMALTGVAMVRQAGANLSISGNLGLRQNALSGADLGTEAAVAWFTPLQGTAVLDNDNVAQGYMSDWGTSEPARLAGDPTRYDWDNRSRLVTADDGSGNEVRYIIERLCLNPNQAKTVAGQQCVEKVGSEGHDMSGTCDQYGQRCPDKPTTVQYRVSSRSKGPRNTASYIQVLLSSS